MILLIDNYDSFTWNLYQYFCELGADVLVRRNDELTLAQIDALSPQKIVISRDPVRRMTPVFRWRLFAISQGRSLCWAFVWGTRRWRRPLARPWFGRRK
jgi:hypothetical protein